MTISRFRLGATSFAAGSLAVLVGRLLFGHRPVPTLTAPGGPTREWEAGQGAPMALADPATRDPSKGEGHPALELAADHHPETAERAAPHFRPDPTAAVPPEDREALRPAPPLESAAQAVADSERAEAV